MDFFRRSEKRPTTFDHARILVPLLGEPSVDGPALKVAALLLQGREGVEASLLHVIEVPFERNLDAEDESAVASADEVLTQAEADRKSTRLNSSHLVISYAVFCSKKKTCTTTNQTSYPNAPPRHRAALP